MDCQPIPKPVYKRAKKQRQFNIEPLPYCQVCGSTWMIDPPHHVEFKQMGGTNRQEVHDPANAISLCRGCHDQAHGIKQPRLSKEELREYKRIDEERQRKYSYLMGE